MAGSNTTMDESTSDFDGTDPRSHLISPWPPFVAIGLTVAELGVVLNLVPLAVGGVVLFGGSIAGILQDAEMTETPWPTVAALGVLFSALGGALWASQLQSYALSHVIAVATANPIAIRGEAVLLGGVLLVVGAVVGIVFEPLQNHSTHHS